MAPREGVSPFSAHVPVWSTAPGFISHLHGTSVPSSGKGLFWGQQEVQDPKLQEASGTGGILQRLVFPLTLHPWAAPGSPHPREAGAQSSEYTLEW